MAGIRIEGNTSGNVMEVTATNEGKVVTPIGDTTGGIRMYTENDAGDATGTPFIMQPETSPDYKLRVGLDTLMFNDTFNTAAGIQNNNIWKCMIASAMVLASGSGALTFNSTSVATSGAGVGVSSLRNFPLIQTAPTYLEFSGYPTATPLANQIMEFGLFQPTTGGVVPAEGVFFRYSSAGLYGVMTYNGVETAIPLPAAATVLTPGSQYSFLLSIGENQTRFWLGGYGEGDVLLGSIETPAANGMPFMQMALPIGMQFRNNNLVTGGPHMMWKMCNVSVFMADFNTNKPWGHQMAGMGLMSSQGQNGHTSILSTAVAATAVPSAAAALVQATAAAQFTGLGGIFRVLPTLASGTEGILCSYLNPLGTINLTPRTLHITGVQIYSAVEVVLAGGPLINVYQLCYGHTAVSLAVATDTATAWANNSVKCPRRIPIGMEVYATNAAVGSMPNPNGLKLDLSTSPIVVNPGEYVAIGLRNQGTVTTSGNLLITVAFTGYWE